ncbi:gliding motility-associated C-terminal domain-containing protein [Flavobacterium sp.]|uniref:gliding motility-associated C-terminal domain-containing protein n=1 Tax=Flavobacterium sp. TaxID=239 RepID=UPI003C3AED84
MLILILFYFTTNIHAQCAGEDNAITVCNITDISSQSINLFNELKGTPIAGGTWTDNKFSGGLETNGSLNVQLIKNSGIYTYTYTSNQGCGINTATISVTVGGYSGVSSPDISACDDNSNFNLFQGFNGNFLSPQSNGNWTDDDGKGGLFGSVLNASVPGLGKHSYTYTMPAIGTCPAQSSTVNVTIFRAPKPGIGDFLLLCSSDNLALYSDFDLTTKLTGADPEGEWSESGTAELSNAKDSKINVQNIYNNFGAGTYKFTYTVFPTNPICTIKKAIVTIIIEEQLDFTGAKLEVNADICENKITTATYNAVITKGIKNVPDGHYSVQYSILSASGITSNTVESYFTNGVLSFPIGSINFQQVGDYTVTINNIASVTSLGACPTNVSIPDVLHIYPLPKIDLATLTIDPVCKGTEALVTFSGTSNLEDGNYSINYNLYGKNTATNQQVVFTITGGIATFTIPSSIISIDGNSTITITQITNLTTGCTNSSNLSKNFIVKSLTDLSTLAIDITNVCEGKALPVKLSGLGLLTNITLNYRLTGANTITNQTIVLTVVSGNTSFTIPPSSVINSGNTSFIIDDIIDNTGGCRTSISNGTKNFTINTLPSIPITTNPKYCKNEMKTVGDLIPNGTQYQWFSSVVSTVVLNASTLLSTGSYFVKEVNSLTGCESGRAESQVEIKELAMPTLNTDGQNFCGLNKPTILDLTANTINNGDLKWYDAAIHGNEISSTTELIDGGTYYGIDFSSTINCFSDALVVTVSLSNCNETPEFFIPDGFSPNGDTVNNTFRIPNIEYIYPNFTFEIFNRYGNSMFHGNKQKPEWDGKTSDASLAIDGYAPNGVYFYVINFNKGNKMPKQGRLYLNR